MPPNKFGMRPKKGRSFEERPFRFEVRYPLEGYPCRYLNFTTGYSRTYERAVRDCRRNDGRNDVTERAARDVRHRIGKVRMVENVKEVGADREMRALG